MPTSFADPAYAAVAIMLALLVLTPWALWEAEQLRTLVRRHLRMAMSRSHDKRDL